MIAGSLPGVGRGHDGIIADLKEVLGDSLEIQFQGAHRRQLVTHHQAGFQAVEAFGGFPGAEGERVGDCGGRAG